MRKVILALMMLLSLAAAVIFSVFNSGASPPTGMTTIEMTASPAVIVAILGIVAIIIMTAKTFGTVNVAHYDRRTSHGALPTHDPDGDSNRFVRKEVRAPSARFSPRAISAGLAA